MTACNILTAVLGLLFGSFVNVLIHRLPHMILSADQNTSPSLRYDLCWPASHCPHCDSTLKAWHNIPVVSYLWLKGRCGFCQERISWRYPLIEITTALIWLMCIGWKGCHAAGFAWAVCFTLLLAASAIDWQTQLLPDVLTQALVWLGLLAASFGWTQLEVTQAVWGAATGYVSLWSVATAFRRITGKHGMGAGDFKLLAGLGAWLGPLALLPVVILASVSGAMVGLWLQSNQRLTEEGHVPFGPFLAIGGVVVAVIGIEPIAMWMSW